MPLNLLLGGKIEVDVFDGQSYPPPRLILHEVMLNYIQLHDLK